jgi:phosphomannomutase/phosphoglucomutase
MKLERTMFREYDIRGRVSDNEINESSAELIGKGFGTMLQKRGVKDCVVGYDSRPYSESLKNALIKGMTSTGVNVVDLGLVLSQITYFGQYHLKVKGCAMITASHNPNGWSGFKLGYDYSSTLMPDDMKELWDIIQDGKFNEGSGTVRQENVIDAYSKDVTGRVKLARKLKVVVNARNGTAGPIVPDILRSAGCEVVEQFCNLDSSFPNGDPNPSIEAMMQEVSDKVKETKADVGFGFDGDGDRVGMVDENGQSIYPDRMLIILARQLIEKYPGSKIVFDVKSTKALSEDIEKHGGVPVIWITGHSYIKQKAHEIGAVLAGERSGHIFYMKDYYGFDDGLFATLKVLEYLSNHKSISNIFEDVPKYFTSPVYHAHCDDEVKYDVIKKIQKKFKEKYKHVIDVNGARVEFEDGWGLIRPSSNLPTMVLVFEGKTEKRMNEIIELFKEELAEYPEISKEWENG